MFIQRLTLKNYTIALIKRHSTNLYSNPVRQPVSKPSLRTRTFLLNMKTPLFKRVLVKKEYFRHIKILKKEYFRYIEIQNKEYNQY